MRKALSMIPQGKKRYITDQAGKRVGVVLDLPTFQKMEDELDNYYSRRAYEKAKPGTNAEIKRGDFVTIEEVISRRGERKTRRRNGKAG